MPSQKGEKSGSVAADSDRARRAKRADRLNHDAWRIMLTDPRQGLKLSEEAAELCELSDIPSGLAHSDLNRGWCYVYLGEFDLALEALLRARDRFKHLKDSEGELKAANGIGVAFQNLGRYQTALEYYGRSLSVARGLGNRERQAAALNNIGEVYAELENREEALHYFGEALRIADELDNEELLAGILVNLGIAYRDAGRPDQASDHLDRAIVYADRIGDKFTKAKCLSALGLVRQLGGELDEAERYQESSLALCDETANVAGRIDALLNLGSIYSQRLEHARALEFQERALEASRGLASKKYAARCYRSLSDTYRDLRKYHKALELYVLHHETERELLDEMSDLQLRSSTIEQRSEIYRLRNIELRRKSEELATAYKHMQIISEIGQKITSILDLERLMTTVHSSVTSLMDATVLGIALYEEDTDEIDFCFFIDRNVRSPRFKITSQATDSFAAWCVRNSREILVRDVLDEYHEYVTRLRHDHEPTRSFIYLPLFIGSKVVALLAVQSYQTNAYTERDLAMLKALGSYIAIAIENSRTHRQLALLNEVVTKEKSELEDAYQRIAHMANHDNLTGLPNRRLLSELLRKSLAQAKRDGSRVAILFCDLDNFKPVNDSFGHDAGDLALRKISQRLLGVLRSSDTVARVGGDEFVAVLTSVHDRESVRRVAEKVLTEMNRPLRIANHSVRVGMSIGISIFPDDDESIDGLLSLADGAMYRSKQATSNTFTFCKGDGSEPAPRPRAQRAGP